MKTNVSFHKAKAQKNDEFYTQLTDIEKELKHYKNHFNGKVVYCNCDDPEKSNFWKFFSLKINDYGIKELISTHYTYIGSAYALHLFPDGTTTKQELLWDGDFRRPECVDILKTADIVVTNPPFSLFREYVDILVQNDKKFLLLGNNNAITYKEIFKLFKENKIWLGYSSNKMLEFEIPMSYEKYSRIENDKKYANVPAISWFTNLEHNKRNEVLILYKKYSENEYPKYDNYDAIEVSKTSDIPVDYDGCMGVPITFLDKLNLEQFEIVALGKVGSIEFSCNKRMEILDKNGRPTGKFTLNAKGTLYRAFNSEKDKIPAFRDVETGQLYSSIYARIIIRRK